MDYQLTQTGPEVQEILDKGAESYSKAEIDAQVDELQDGIDSSVKNKGSESNIVVGVGNSSNIGITSSSIGMETGNSAILIGNDITLDTSGAVKYNGSRVATATDLQGKQDVIRDLQTIRDGAAAGATAVQPAAMNTALAAKQDTISDLSTIRSGAAAGATAVQPAALQSGLAGKQDTISDLSTIRSGASAGATAYQKPQAGIPKTDLASAVQTLLNEIEGGFYY